MKVRLKDSVTRQEFDRILFGREWGLSPFDKIKGKVLNSHKSADSRVIEIDEEPKNDMLVLIDEWHMLFEEVK